MNYTKLKKFCIDQGADLFGVADIKEVRKDFFLPQETLAKLDKAICIGVRLSQAVLEQLPQAPNRLYYHHYRAVNALLDELALRCANFIQKKGFRSLPIPASQIIDIESKKVHLSHRHLAVSAGLGWIGRNNLLVNKEFGSQLRLVTVLTDMPLKVNKPNKNNCGLCRLCITVCPAQAIKEDAKDFDLESCADKLQEFKRQHLVEQLICGVCVNVCKGKVK